MKKLYSKIKYSIRLFLLKRKLKKALNGRVAMETLFKAANSITDLMRGIASLGLSISEFARAYWEAEIQNRKRGN